MKFFTLSLAVLISACSASSTTPSEHVKVVTKLEQACKFIRLQKCESYRDHGAKRCYKRLGKMAAKAGADTVLIDDMFEHSRMIQLDNNAFGEEKTIVEASFYQCGAKQAKQAK